MKHRIVAAGVWFCLLFAGCQPVEQWGNTPPSEATYPALVDGDVHELHTASVDQRCTLSFRALGQGTSGDKAVDPGSLRLIPNPQYLTESSARYLGEDGVWHTFDPDVYQPVEHQPDGRFVQRHASGRPFEVQVAERLPLAGQPIIQHLSLFPVVCSSISANETAVFPGGAEEVVLRLQALDDGYVVDTPAYFSYPEARYVSIPGPTGLRDWLNLMATDHRPLLHHRIDYHLLDYQPDATAGALVWTQLDVPDGTPAPTGPGRWELRNVHGQTVLLIWTGSESASDEPPQVAAAIDGALWVGRLTPRDSTAGVVDPSAELQRRYTRRYYNRAALDAISAALVMRPAFGFGTPLDAASVITSGNFSLWAEQYDNIGTDLYAWRDWLDNGVLRSNDWIRATPLAPYWEAAAPRRQDALPATTLNANGQWQETTGNVQAELTTAGTLRLLTDTHTGGRVVRQYRAVNLEGTPMAMLESFNFGWSLARRPDGSSPVFAAGAQMLSERSVQESTGYALLKPVGELNNFSGSEEPTLNEIVRGGHLWLEYGVGLTFAASDDSPTSGLARMSCSIEQNYFTDCGLVRWELRQVGQEQILSLGDLPARRRYFFVTPNINPIVGRRNGKLYLGAEYLPGAVLDDRAIIGFNRQALDQLGAALAAP